MNEISGSVLEIRLLFVLLMADAWLAGFGLKMSSQEESKRLEKTLRVTGTKIIFPLCSSLSVLLIHNLVIIHEPLQSDAAVSVSSQQQHRSWVHI